MSRWALLPLPEARMAMRFTLRRCALRASADLRGMSSPEAPRTVRHFSDLPVPQVLMEALIATAATAPSAAHKQPWTFCLVGEPELKRRIRQAAEEEEHASYHGRMSAEWLADLAPLGTDRHKPFLETAPRRGVGF